MLRGNTVENTKRKYVGKCIYCGATENLQDEHCIPESLNGLHLLEKASCSKCGKITGKFEGRFTRDSLLPLRTAWNMKSKRSKSKRPKEFPMRFIIKGEQRLINVPVEDHIPLIPLVEIGPMGKYPFNLHKKGLKHGQFYIDPFNSRSEEHLKNIQKKYDADDIGVDYNLHTEDFLRMIAKIAYCFTVWEYGLKNIGEVYVLPAILGQSNDIWHWVGGDGIQEIYKESKNMKADHVVSTGFLSNGELQTRVKLFKNSETPEYEVAVGRLTKLAHDFYRSMGFC